MLYRFYWNQSFVENAWPWPQASLGHNRGTIEAGRLDGCVGQLQGKGKTVKRYDRGKLIYWLSTWSPFVIGKPPRRICFGLRCPPTPRIFFVGVSLRIVLRRQLQALLQRAPMKRFTCLIGYGYFYRGSPLGSPEDAALTALMCKPGDFALLTHSSK